MDKAEVQEAEKMKGEKVIFGVQWKWANLFGWLFCTRCVDQLWWCSGVEQRCGAGKLVIKMKMELKRKNWELLGLVRELLKLWIARHCSSSALSGSRLVEHDWKVVFATCRWLDRPKGGLFWHTCGTFFLSQQRTSEFGSSRASTCLLALVVRERKGCTQRETQMKFKKLVFLAKIQPSISLVVKRLLEKEPHWTQICQLFFGKQKVLTSRKNSRFTWWRFSSHYRLSNERSTSIKPARRLARPLEGAKIESKQTSREMGAYAGGPTSKAFRYF